MNWKEYQRLYWSKYLYLENRVLETSNYVTMDMKNYEVFSNVYEVLLVSICTEIESVLCEWNKVNGNIKKHIDNLMRGNEDEFNKEISVLFSEIKLKPFDKLTIFLKSQNANNYSLDTKNDLEWWYVYNKLKHDKLQYYTMANLKNILNALSALFILENLRIKQIGEEEKRSGKTKDTHDCPYKPSILLRGEFNTKEIVIGADLFATL